MNPIKTALLAALFFLGASIFPFQLKACDLSSLTLDSIVPVGVEYDLYLTLCIGGGITGTTKGGDGDTRDFVFGFYSSCTSQLCFSFFPPFVVGDSTGAVQPGVNLGPLPSPFSTQATIGYFPAGPPNPLVCVSTTAACGNVHQQCDQYRFRMNVIPDSIRVFGVEGNGNPLAGCYPNTDMAVNLTNMGGSTACCGDTIPPTIVCPVSPAIYVDSICPVPLPDFSGAVTLFDNCTASPNLVQTPAPNTPLGTGPTTVIMQASDCFQNSASCSFTVFVFDTIAPIALCKNVTLLLDTTGQASLSVLAVDSGSIDNCPGISLNLSQSSFDCSDIGTNSVTLTVSDLSSNSASCSAVVTVVDNTPPSLACPQNLTAQGVGSGQNCGNTVGWSNPVASDNCQFSLVPSIASGSYFTVGTQQVTYTATDASGNSVSCGFSVTVLPPPVLNAAFSYTPVGNLTLAFSDATSPNAQIWNWDFGDGGTSSQQSPSHVYAQGGTYTACLAVSDGCSADTACQTITLVGLEEAMSGSLVKVYPNPGASLFYLELGQLDSPVLRIQLLDVLGRKLLEISPEGAMPGKRLEINTDGVSPGIYYLEVAGWNWRETVQVVIQ